MFSFLTHNGKEIAYVDHRGLIGSQIVDSMKDACERIRNSGKKSILVLVDFRDSTGSKEVNDYLNSDETKSMQVFYARQAIVGISGIKKLMLNAYSAVVKSDMKAFDDIENAKRYLTE